MQLIKTTSLTKLRALYGFSNIEALAHTSSAYDKAFYNYLLTFPQHVRDLVNKCDPNRGDMCETAHSEAPTNRTGKQVQSHGDIRIQVCDPETLASIREYMNGTPCEAVEMKFITPKTKASDQRKGTTANAFIVVFADKVKVFARLIKPSDLITEGGQITFQDNATNGIAIDLRKLKIKPID